jgi:cytoskeletal protein CcmA (bactofilin family)
MANIGKSITIKGEVTGDEDLVVEGRVEGRFDLKNHHLTIGTNGDVKAEVAAKAVTVIGRVTGNITATERIEIRETGRVDGDLVAPRLLVQEGAQVNGAITMKPVGAAVGAAVGAPAVQGGPRLEPARKAL